MSVKAVIFDWAGTTVDYGCMAPVGAFYQAFLHYGIELTNEEIREPMGMLKVDHIRVLLSLPRVKDIWQEKYGQAATQIDVDDLYQLFEKELFRVLAENVALKPKTLATVEWLKAKGIKIGSTTGYTDEMMKVVTKNAQNQGYQPDFIVTPDSVNHFGRPYPYMIFRNLEALEIVSVEETLKVGDTVSDILEGKNAGLKTVGVLEGSSLIGLSEEEWQRLSFPEQMELKKKAEKKYIEAGADYVINHLGELKDLITG